MYNVGLREKMKTAGVRHWETAEAMDISEGKFCRMLRRELSEIERAKVEAAIEKAKALKYS